MARSTVGYNTPLTSLNRTFCRHRRGAKVRLPCSKDDNFIASVFLTFQLSKGTCFEMPLRVLTVFSQYILAFLIMLAYTHACKSCSSLAYNATCLAPPLAPSTTPTGHYVQCIALIALVALHCVAMNCIIALRCIALHCVALHCLPCIALGHVWNLLWGIPKSANGP